jgi:uncharacterized membrane protein
MTDLLYSSRFEGFLSNPAYAVDITSAEIRASCLVEGMGAQPKCPLTYYVAVGVENFAPELLEALNAEGSDAFLAVVGRSLLLLKPPNARTLVLTFLESTRFPLRV